MCGIWEGIGAWARAAKLTGILVDAYTDLDPQGYHNFSVVEEPLTSLPGSLDDQTPTMEPIERVPIEEGVYLPLYRLTTGSLHDVTRLVVRRHGKRCLGLQILHSNEMDDILGSWDPLDTSSMTTLYESRQGPLATLKFHLTDGEYEPYVNNITTCIKARDLPMGDTKDCDANEAPRQLSPPRDPTTTIKFSCGDTGKVGYPGPKNISW